MSTLTLQQNAVSQLAAQADAIGNLAQDTGAFAAVVAAFESNDPDALSWVLQRLELLPQCELICEWIRVKLCGLRCVEVCGPPVPTVPVPGLPQFAHALTRLASNENLLRRAVDAVSCGDADSYHAAIAEAELQTFCHLLCRYICSALYRRICEVVCARRPVAASDAALDIRADAEVLRRVVANDTLTGAIVNAAEAFDCDLLRKAVETAGFASNCEIICRLVCIWRCVRVCRDLCVEPPPILRGTYAVEEARKFALAARQLAGHPRALSDLAAAVISSNAEAYRAIVNRFGLGPYCWQVCGWVCSEVCYEFCVCVCPPASTAYFIKIGQYEYSEVYPPGGTTPKIESQIGGSGLTNDNRAFWRTLRLNGSFSFETGAPQMEYRFETIQADAAGNPLTGAVWQPVLSAPGAGIPAVIGYNIIHLINPPFFEAVPVYGSLDAQGWIQVPLPGPSYSPTEDLLLLDSTKLSGAPHLDETGVVAGGTSAISSPLAQDLYFGIRMRVRNVGDTSDGTDGGTCDHIAIDNTSYDNVVHQPAWRNLKDPPGDPWVRLVDIQELLGPNGCGEITNSLTVLFTAAHPNLGSVSLQMDGPGGPYAFTLIPAAGSSSVNYFGTATPSGFDVANLQPCAYLVTLTANALLTDGDNEPDPLYDQIAFCKR
jgi:hypothetical protein